MSEETFDFSEALRRMKEGKKVRRKNEWDFYIIFNARITIGTEGMPIERYTPTVYPFNNQDLLATDWEEVEG